MNVNYRRVFAQLKLRSPTVFEQSHLFSSFFYKKMSSGATRVKGWAVDVLYHDFILAEHCVQTVAGVLSKC